MNPFTRGFCKVTFVLSVVTITPSSGAIERSTPEATTYCGVFNRVVENEKELVDLRLDDIEIPRFRSSGARKIIKLLNARAADGIVKDARKFSLCVVLGRRVPLHFENDEVNAKPVYTYRELISFIVPGLGVFSGDSSILHSEKEIVCGKMTKRPEDHRKYGYLNYEISREDGGAKIFAVETEAQIDLRILNKTFWWDQKPLYAQKRAEKNLARFIKPDERSGCAVLETRERMGLERNEGNDKKPIAVAVAAFVATEAPSDIPRPKLADSEAVAVGDTLTELQSRSVEITEREFVIEAKRKNQSVEAYLRSEASLIPFIRRMESERFRFHSIDAAEQLALLAHHRARLDLHALKGGIGLERFPIFLEALSLLSELKGALR